MATKAAHTARSMHEPGAAPVPHPRPSASFPAYLRPLTQLVREHAKRKDEPLHLAIYYAPKRRRGDVFLFEVIGHFGDSSIDPDGDIFEVAFGSTPQFPLSPGRSLRMLLTNPEEFRTAAQERWKAFEELKSAVDAGRAEILRVDSKGRALLGLL